MQNTGRIVSGWAVAGFTPLQLSEAFTNLGISHCIVSRIGNTLSLRREYVGNICADQYVWPVIVNTVAAAKKLVPDRELEELFVCDSYPALANTNLRTFNSTADLRFALWGSTFPPKLDETWSLSIDEPDIQDYVAQASRPSILNEIQTALYKITPYSDRKVVQEKIIHYLGGKLSFRVVNQLLRTSPKLEKLKQLIATPEVAELRYAIKRVTAGEDQEVVADEMGIEIFDISYIYSSVRKSQT
jgi:hypothetical protein